MYINIYIYTYIYIHIGFLRSYVAVVRSDYQSPSTIEPATLTVALIVLPIAPLKKGALFELKPLYSAQSCTESYYWVGFRVFRFSGFRVQGFRVGFFVQALVVF